MKKILVVDDEQDIADLLKILIESSYELVNVGTITDINEDIVYDADTWQDADIVLLDLMMPVAGVDIFKYLRQHYPSCKIIICSAYEAEKRAQELGADGVLAKPFSPEQLKQVIDSI